MLIDMKAILIGKADALPFSFDWDGASEFFSEYEFTVPVHIEGKVVNRSGYMLLTLSADSEYVTSCARCLERLDRKFSYTLEKNVALEGELNGTENDDYIIVHGSVLDLTETVQELLFLELPSRDLCREDCRGLCPKCGKSLNIGDCGCEKKEIDPRLAVLSKYLKNQE